MAPKKGETHAQPLRDGTPFLLRSGTSAERSQKYEIMARWAAKLRGSHPTMPYGELHRAVRNEFKVGKGVAGQVITRAAEILREAFAEFCQDAPRIIFDAYLGLYNESVDSMREIDEEIRVADKSRLAGLHRMKRQYLIAGNRVLDSVRDTFGMRGAVNVRILNGGGPKDATPPPEAYAGLTDDQLEALAKLDELAPGAIDADSTEVSDAMEEAAADGIDWIPEDDDEDEDDE